MKKFLLMFLIAPLIHSCGKHVVNSVYYDDKYTDTSISYILIDSTSKTSVYLDSIINEYRISLEKSMNEVIGYSKRPLTKAQPECTLGYLAVDALYEYAHQQDSLVMASVVNYGGIRISYLSPGTVTIGHIYEIMPFDNTVVVIQVPGSVIIEWCNHMASKGGWPIYGITYELKDKQAENVQIQGKAIHENLIYRVATTDYIANGGDDCEFLKGLKRVSYNKFHRDTMIDFIHRITNDNDSLNYELEKRILYNE